MGDQGIGSKAFHSDTDNTSETWPKDTYADCNLHSVNSAAGLLRNEPSDDLDDLIDPAQVEQEEEGEQPQCKKNLVSEERARALATQSKFFEAISCLEDIEQNEDEISRFGVNLLKAECYIQLGRETKAEKSIKAVKRALLNGPEIEVDLLISLAESLSSAESFIRSMILIKIASDIYKESRRSASEILDGIARCIDVSKMVQIGGIKHLVKPDDRGFVQSSAWQGTSSERQRIVVLDFGVEYMKQMLNDLRAIPGVDPEKQAIKVGWSVINIGYVFANVGKEFDKSYKILTQGIQAMDAVFGENAGHHRVYGVILHNMGTSLHNNHKFAEAVEVYERAVRAKEMALDFGGPEKQIDLQATRETLEQTRKHMIFA